MSPLIDWGALPVVEVAVGRFVLCLAGIDVAALARHADPQAIEPVLAMTRCGARECGDVLVYNGRHRVLRALLLGWNTIPARVLSIP